MKLPGIRFHLSAIILVIIIHDQTLGQDLEIPRASPKASVSQYVGVCNVMVQYGRPSTRSREIFGGLVPFDKVWRAGANEATTLSFSHDVRLGTSEVPAGKYGYYANWIVQANGLSLPGEKRGVIRLIR